MLTVHIRALVVHPQRRGATAVAFVGFAPAEPVVMICTAPSVLETLHGIVSQAYVYSKVTAASRN